MYKDELSDVIEYYQSLPPLPKEPKKYIIKQYGKTNTGVCVRVKIGKVAHELKGDSYEVTRIKFIRGEHHHCQLVSDKCRVSIANIPLFAEYKISKVRTKEYSGDGTVYYEALVDGKWKHFFKKDQTAKTKKMLPVQSQIEFGKWVLNEVIPSLRKYYTKLSSEFKL